MTDRDFGIDLQVLTETIRGRYAMKEAFANAKLSGVVDKASNMPNAQPKWIGKTITMPYFGILGEFSDNPEGSSTTPLDIDLTSQDATVFRSSIAFEVSRWARGNAPSDADPYEESADQAMVASDREMDRAMIAAANAAELTFDVYSATSPQQLNPDVLAEARGELWGDEASENVEAMITHSRSMMGLRKLVDGVGRPLLFENHTEANEIPRFQGLSVVESDRTPITGTDMTAVVSVGTGTEPTMVITGTATGLWKLRVRKYNATTTLGSGCTVQFSTNGGKIWSDPIAIPTTAAVALIDPAKDSRVGNNGTTGLLVAFSGNFTATDNVYGANAIPKLTTFVCKKQAMAYWYAGHAFKFDTDKNILKDTEIAAAHLYYAACVRRRVPYGTKPGVIRIIHNGLPFTAVTTTELSALAVA